MRLLKIVLFTVLLFFLGRTVYYDYTDEQIITSKIVAYKFKPNPAGIYEGAIRIYQGGYMCSAVVINSHYALTAAHCGTGYGRFMTKEIVVVRNSLDESTKITAKFIALNHERDIALLDGDFSRFKAYPLNTTFSPTFSTHMVSCGFPSDATLVCNSVYFAGNYWWLYRVVGPPLEQGSSGGPVFDDAGEVVGVNSAVTEGNSIISPTTGLEGLFGL